MKKFICKQGTSRQDLANPFRHMSYHERLVKKNGTIDLKDNLTIEDLGNKYIRVKPIDNTKLVK